MWVKAFEMGIEAVEQMSVCVQKRASEFPSCVVAKISDYSKTAATSISDDDSQGKPQHPATPERRESHPNELRALTAKAKALVLSEEEPPSAAILGPCSAGIVTDDSYGGAYTDERPSCSASEYGDHPACCEAHLEPLLQENPDRFSMFPIQ